MHQPADSHKLVPEHGVSEGQRHNDYGRNYGLGVNHGWQSDDTRSHAEKNERNHGGDGAKHHDSDLLLFDRRDAAEICQDQEDHTTQISYSDLQEFNLSDGIEDSGQELHADQIKYVKSQSPDSHSYKQGPDKKVKLSHPSLSQCE